MEPERSILRSQEPSTGPYPEPYKSNLIYLRSILILSSYLHLKKETDPVSETLCSVRILHDGQILKIISFMRGVMFSSDTLRYEVTEYSQTTDYNICCFSQRTNIAGPIENDLRSLCSGYGDCLLECTYRRFGRVPCPEESPVPLIWRRYITFKHLPDYTTSHPGG
jgi:hypothetical protein